MRHSKQPFNLLDRLRHREMGECNPRVFMLKTLIHRLKVDYGVTSDPNSSVEYLQKLYDRCDQDYEIFRRQISESDSAEGLVVRLLTKYQPWGKKGLELLREILNKRDAVAACQEMIMMNIRGITPLHYAVSFECSLIINALLERLGNKTVDVCRRDSHSPLHMAALNGSEVTVNAILEQLGDVGAEICRQQNESNRHTPLHYACLSGNTAIVKTILSKLGAAASNACRDRCLMSNDKMGTPIHYVVQKGSEDIIEVMFNLVGDEFLGENGWELLCLAAKSGNVAALRLLFCRLGEKAATRYCVQRDDETQHTLLFYAAESGSADAFKLILRQLRDKAKEVSQWNISIDAFKSIVSELCSDDVGSEEVDEDVFKLMLKELDDNEEEVRDRGTLLRVACIKGHAAVIEVIIKKLGEVFSNADKQELLSLVVKSGKIEAVNLILEQFGGEAARICQQNGTALLHDAVLSKSGAVVNRMLELFGDEASKICQADITILFEVVKKMDLAVIKTILRRLGDRAIEACMQLNDEGSTPLHLTAELAFHFDGVEAILEKLGDRAKEVCQQSNNDGNTPLHCVVEEAKNCVGEKFKFECTNAVKAMLETLSKEEATNICQKPNKYNHTPLLLAADSECAVLVDTILKQLEQGKAKEVCQIPDLYGNTPLDLAVKSGCWDVVKLFLDILGDEVKAEEDKLIHLARESENLECHEQLSNYLKELNSEHHIDLS